MNKPRLVLLILSSIVIVLLIVRVYILADLGVLDYEYFDIQEEIKRQQRANMIIQETLLEKEALNTIHDEAIDQGFIPATVIFFTQ